MAHDLSDTPDDTSKRGGLSDFKGNKVKLKQKNKQTKSQKTKFKASKMNLVKASNLGSLWTEDVNKKLEQEETEENMSDKLREEIDMAQVNEYKYGATHEFRGQSDFMEKHAEKIFKKHGIQIHSVELLPEEKEVVFHVSGSAEALQKATIVLWNLANPATPKTISYKPPKFGGQTKKIIHESVETEETEELTVDEILGEGPKVLFSTIVDEDENANEIFQEVLGAKIDVMLDGLRKEIAGTMFNTITPEVE